MEMKITLSQMNVVPGNIKKNINNMLASIAEAKEKESDVIAFPEMCIGGYMLGDYYRDRETIDEIVSAHDIIKEASDNITIIFGSVLPDYKNKNNDGRFRLYNAIYVYRDKDIVNRSFSSFLVKSNLPNYRIFDDKRYFSNTVDFSNSIGSNKIEDFFHPILIKEKQTDNSFRDIPVGIELCEDLWCSDYEFALESLNPTCYFIKNGAQFIINLSASPWTCGKNEARDRRVKEVRDDCKKRLGYVSEFVPFFYVNCVGVQNNGKNIITFDGGSTVYNNNGDTVVFANQEGLPEDLLFDTNSIQDSKPRKNIEKIEQKFLAIVHGLIGFKTINGLNDFPTVVIGISGGIDSAVVAALCVYAFGKNKVIGVNMPSKYNSEKTRNAAKELADNLGIEYLVIPIEDINEETKKTLKNYSGQKITPLADENIQAKIRATSILSNLAQCISEERNTPVIFTNNGNKIEIALGYATLYGDWGGAISPIGDLTKQEVYEMAKYLGKIIPNEMLPDDKFEFTEDKIAPSAELKYNQLDPILIGYHCAIINSWMNYNKKSPSDFLRWWLEGTLAKNLNIDPYLITKYKMDIAENFVQDLKWVFTKFRQAAYKRVQSPPIIITSKTAFGYDWREPILPPFEFSNEANSLIKEILLKKVMKNE